MPIIPIADIDWQVVTGIAAILASFFLFLVGGIASLIWWRLKSFEQDAREVKHNIGELNGSMKELTIKVDYQAKHESLIEKIFDWQREHEKWAQTIRDDYNARHAHHELEIKEIKMQLQGLCRKVGI